MNRRRLNHRRDPLDALLGELAAAPAAGPREAFRGTPRFEVRAQIGQGGFGTVYSAFDKRLQRSIALKLLERHNPDWLYRFKREFRLVEKVRHPNLVELYELHVVPPHAFFTMELVEGWDFGRYLHERPHMLRAGFLQLAEGLAALHAANLVHRDIKPSNVRVTRADKAKLLDFGLTRSASSTDLTDAFGTPGYMAPELQGQAVAERPADLYAFGMMLHEALQDGCVLSANATELRHKPRAATAGTSELARASLLELAGALLSPSPEQRPDVFEVVRILRRTLRARRSSPAPTSRTATAIFGRGRELRRLGDALTATVDKPVVALLHGVSGIGKSTLIRHFVQLVAARPDALVFESRCYAAETVPYRALDAWIDSLSNYLKALPVREQRSIAPLRMDALYRLFPILERVPGFPARQRPQEYGEVLEQERSRGVSVLGELLQRLSVGQKLVVVLDDLQWVDGDSVRILADLLRPPDPPAFTLIASVRREAMGAQGPCSELLELLRAQRAHELLEVELGCLSSRSLRLHLRRLTATGMVIDPSRTEELIRECEGNPCCLRFLLEYEGSGASGPLTLARALGAKVFALAVVDRELLELVAVCRGPVDAGLLLRAGQATPSTLAHLAEQGLVRRAPEAESLVVMAHDMLREAVLASLSESDCIARHLRLAVVLQTEPSADPESLVEHLAGAGMAAEAGGRALAAAQFALDELAFERAARLYEIALESGVFSATDRARIEELRAVALRAAGRLADAGQAYLAASRLLPSEQAWELGRLAGEQLLLSGSLAHGFNVLADTLRVLGLAFPETVSDALAEASLLLPQIQGLHPPPRSFEPDATGLRSRRLDVALSLTMALTDVDLRVAPFAIRGLLDALSIGDAARLQRAAALFAAAVKPLGADALAQEALALARELATRSGDPYARAIAYWSHASVAHYDGAFLEAEAACEQAESLLLDECQDVLAETNHVRGLTVVVHYSHKGDFRTIASRSLRWLAEAEARQDAFTANWLRAAHTLLWIARDDPPRARAELDRARASWPEVSGGTFDVAWAFYADIVDRYTEVACDWRMAGQGLHVVLSSPVSQTRLLGGYVPLHRAWIALRAVHAGRAACEARTTLAGALDQLDEVGLASWAAVGMGLRANLDWIDQEPVRALARLEQAEIVLRTRGMLALAACARRRRGELSGEPARAKLICSADERLSALGVVRPAAFARTYFSPFAV